MELREYFRILLKNWWIIVPLTLLALTTSLVVSYAQTPIYRATSTYVTGLAPSLGSIDATIYGVDTLSGRQGIFVTYCGVMSSAGVRYRAYELAGFEDFAAQFDEEYTVACNVLPESNILFLMVDGPSTAVALRLNEAIGLAGMERTNKLYTYFPVENLDAVSLESDPVKPNYGQNAALGGILGIVLGITLAFVIEYLRSPLDRLEALSIRNPTLGVYNERYFERRFDEELKRARVRNRPISLAFLELLPDEDFVLLERPVQDSLMRLAALLIQDSVREGDIVAYYGNYVFGILLAETPGDEARSMLVNLHYAIRAKTFRYQEFSASFVARTGLVESSGGALGVHAMMAKASEALRDAEVLGDNAIQFIRTSPAPFFDGNQQTVDEIQSAASVMAFESGIDESFGQALNGADDTVTQADFSLEDSE